jgi:enoyl-CoA hydratase/carnithine racemase
VGSLEVDEPADGVVRLTISNPAKRNALDREILDALERTLPALDARCVVLTGAGSIFSAGYDIGDLAPERLAEEAAELVAHPFQAALEALDAVVPPVVAALNGHAIGGGLELALGCDLRVMASGSRVGMPPARLGLVYSHTGLRRFLDAIGGARTRELFLTARLIDAREALGWGLVNEVVGARQQARAARAAGRAAGPGGHRGAGRAARGVLPLRGLRRGRARVRREALAPLAGPLRSDDRGGAEGLPCLTGR